MAKTVHQAEMDSLDKELLDILNLLAKGPKRPNEIQLEMGLSRRQWENRLGQLKGAGLIEPEIKTFTIGKLTGRYKVKEQEENGGRGL